MPVHIKSILPAAERPAVPDMSRWFSVLALLIAVGTGAGVYLDKQAGSGCWLRHRFVLPD